MTVLNKASKALIIDLINENAGTAYVDADLIFGDPEPWLADNDSERNTMVMVNKAAYPDAEDAQAIYYNRLDLGGAGMFGDRQVEIEFATGVDTVLELLPFINSRYNMALDATDIEDAAINVAGAFPVTAVIVAKSTSYAYIGQFSVTLTKETPAVAGDTITANFTLTGAFVDGSSKFKADTTVTATNFKKTAKDDGNLTLALRARDVVAGPVAPAANGDYKLANVASDVGNWMLDVAIASSIVGGRMEAQHNFKVVLESDADGDTPFELTLVYTGGTYKLTNGAIALAEGFAAADGSLVEFSIDMAELAINEEFTTAFANAIFNEDFAPYGTFDASLIATNIATPATKHYVGIVVDCNGTAAAP